MWRLLWTALILLLCRTLRNGYHDLLRCTSTLAIDILLQHVGLLVVAQHKILWSLILLILMAFGRANNLLHPVTFVDWLARVSILGLFLLAPDCSNLPLFDTCIATDFNSIDWSSCHTNRFSSLTKRILLRLLVRQSGSHCKVLSHLLLIDTLISLQKTTIRSSHYCQIFYTVLADFCCPFDNWGLICI